MTFRYDPARFIPFRDVEICARVRAIKREVIAIHPNPDFKIQTISDPGDFYEAFAQDLVGRIRTAGTHKIVMILPNGPMAQYRVAADLINRGRISCRNLVTFSMNEFADQNGNTAPADWIGSCQRAMIENFFLKIDPQLRPDLENIHFPTREHLSSYEIMIEDEGGIDVCYGGIGWSGNFGLWEADLGQEFGDGMGAFRKAGPRCVELGPMTIMLKALLSFGGDWSWVPPKANTIGPHQVVSARHRSFWLDGDLGGSLSWQRFIARLCAHGPISPLIPASLLQTLPGTYTILGNVADNVEVHMA